MRGNVYHTAEDIVPKAYGLHRFDGDLSKMALAVGELLSNYNYLYPGSFKVRLLIFYLNCLLS